MSSTKQNLKANHNLHSLFSQQLEIAFTGQRYKIWKQITTTTIRTNVCAALLLLVKDTKFESKSQQNTLVGKFIEHCFYWSKIQNLKANHNTLARGFFCVPIAFTGQRYKIWKQITTKASTALRFVELLLLVKDTKFESKSQLVMRHLNGFTIAFTGQRYKIWKQITTKEVRNDKRRILLLLVKDTKFESKSQPIDNIRQQTENCFYWSKIQNLKANHNR